MSLAAQGAQGQQPQPPPQPGANTWRTWQREEDLTERRQLITHIYRLFSQRQRAGMNQEWNEKLPDFVRRLEEALYRTASSKEEYSDVNTLEARLQNVARRMVSTTARRSNPGPPSVAPGVPQAPNGFAPQPGGLTPGYGAPGQPSTSYAGPVSSNGMLQPSNSGPNPMMPVGSTGINRPPASAMMNVASNGQYMSSTAMGSLPGARGGQPGAMHQGVGMGLGAAALPKVESGLNGMGMAGLGPLQPGHPAMLRGQSSGPGHGQIMSNGAPVLLRNTRDWVPGQTPSMINTVSGQPQSNRITINGMAPGQLGAGSQAPGTGSGALLAGSHASQAMRVGSAGNAVMSNGMIPMLGQGQGSQPMHMPQMVPVAMQAHSSSQDGLPGGGMVPVSGMGGLGSGPGVGSSAMSGGGTPSMGSGVVPPGMVPTSGPMGMSHSMSPADAPTEADQIARQQRRDYVAKQQRWLLFLRHCAKCQAPEGLCQYGESCRVAKQLWRHILTCADPQCDYPRCVTSRELLKHHQKCVNQACPVCTPVKQYVQRQRQAVAEAAAAAQRARAAGAGMPAPHPGQALPGYPPGPGMVPQVGPGGVRNGMVPVPGAAPGSMVPVRHMIPVGDEPAAKRQKSAQAPVPLLETSRTSGTSLVEAFAALEIRVHLDCLRGTGAAGPLPPRAPGAELPDWDDANACAACGQTRLTFEPPSIYCTCCGQRIKRNQVFYSTPLKKSEVKGNWCHSCCQDHRGDRIDLDGTSIRKAELEKRRNDEETEEGWVECSRCERWVHQICGLFNKGRNDESVPYICPMCLLEELENGRRAPIAVRPQAMLEAKDLQQCDLSRFLEQRVAAALDADRVARAERAGLLPDQVPAATGLTIRVINNVTKKMEVKPKFHEAFHNDGYPDAFPYRQKVILLFQKLDGVDVCLYCLYMQEYGDECPAPNRKWVYLSYLDSIKYFRPEVDAARGGMALRTLVYHEILLAYLVYIKQRGFTSMFIWACPPLQGDDYILYCHPNRQKTPRSDRLREWYHAMLRTAKEAGTVLHLSNLFDTFFEGGRDHRLDRPSATHLPYFDGDYWPGEAEALLANMGEEARVAGKKGKAGGRAAKATKGKRYGAGPATTDAHLMARLGEVIQGMKEDFIVVHLQEPCSSCRAYISDDTRHFHPAPPAKTVRSERTFEGISLDTPGQSGKTVTTMSRFQLCPGCYAAEASGAGGGVDGCGGGGGGTLSGEAKARRALPGGMALAELRAAKQEAIPATTDAGNPDMLCEFFDTRQAFLSLCQGNHYQFDSMRRAKHSSMMVLYHLHNPDAPAFVASCNQCGNEIEPGQGFRCSVCQDFDMCAGCKVTTGHVHPLVPHARKIDETRARMTEEERHERAAQLQRTMALLVHASACANGACPSSNCHKVKLLFQHAVSCQRKVTGGCQLCRRMWMLLQMHAKQCQAVECPVPRCRELREMRRRQIARQEEQRRVAYQAMLRKQAAARKAAKQGALKPESSRPAYEPHLGPGAAY